MLIETLYRVTFPTSEINRAIKHFTQLRDELREAQAEQSGYQEVEQEQVEVKVDEATGTVELEGNTFEVVQVGNEQLLRMVG